MRSKLRRSSGSRLQTMRVGIWKESKARWYLSHRLRDSSQTDAISRRGTQENGRKFPTCFARFSRGHSFYSDHLQKICHMDGKHFKMWRGRSFLTLNTGLFGFEVRLHNEKSWFILYYIADISPSNKNACMPLCWKTNSKPKICLKSELCLYHQVSLKRPGLLSIVFCPAKINNVHHLGIPKQWLGTFYLGYQKNSNSFQKFIEIFGKVNGHFR